MNHKPSNIYIQLWHQQEPKQKNELPQLFKGDCVEIATSAAQESKLLTTLLSDFEDAGSLQHPLELLLNPALDAASFKDFFITPFWLTSLSDKAKSLSLACHLAMPDKQRNLEYLLRRHFRQLTLDEALSQAQDIQDLGLSLPPSFLSMLAAPALTAFFARAYPLGEIKEERNAPGSFNARIKALREKIIRLHHRNCAFDFSYLDLKQTHIRYINNRVGIFYRDPHQQEDILYREENMPEPTLFKGALPSSTLLYAINYQGTKIIYYTTDHQCVAWDKINYTLDDKPCVEWVSSIIDYDTPDYCYILFSNDDSMFLTLNKIQEDSIIIKVWHAKSNQILASYVRAWSKIFTSIDFFNRNTQLIVRSGLQNFEIFDIATNTVIENWRDTSLNCTYYAHNDYKIKKHAEEQYYILQCPLSLYDNNHHRLITFNKESLYLSPGANSNLLEAEFSTNNTIVIKKVVGGTSSIFNLNKLDTILQHSNKLTLPQAVALLLFSKPLTQESTIPILLENIVATLPLCIKNLLKDVLTAQQKILENCYGPLYQDFATLNAYTKQYSL